jgi:hypothetical protein
MAFLLDLISEQFSYEWKLNVRDSQMAFPLNQSKSNQNELQPITAFKYIPHGTLDFPLEKRSINDSNATLLYLG